MPSSLASRGSSPSRANSAAAVVAREPAVGREGLGHLAEGSRKERPPALPAGDEPLVDGPLDRPPAQAVRLADDRRQEPDRRPERPRVRPRGQASQQRRDRTERRVENDVGQLAGGRADLDRAARRERPIHVPLERREIGREERLGDSEGPPDRQRLGVVAGAARRRERLEPAVGDDDRGIDEGRVDPQPELRVASLVGRAGDRPVERVQTADLRTGRRRRSVHDPEVAPERAVEPSPRIGSEVAVIGHACSNLGVGELEQEGARSGTEQQHRLAVERPCLGRRAVQSDGVVGVDDPRPRHERRIGHGTLGR